jgi:hypothetical protein
MLPYIKPEHIVDLFRNLDIAEVDTIEFTDRMAKNTFTPYKTAHIYFRFWHDTDAARTLQRNIETATREKPAKIIYDDPFSWVLIKNMKKPQEPKEKLFQPCESTFFINRVKHDIHVLEDIIYVLTEENRKLHIENRELRHNYKI